MTTAFVTGGSGFVGRNLIAMMVAKDWTVKALARSAKAEAAVREAGAQPVKGDLDDLAAMREGMRGCDVVFHSGAKVEDWGVLDDFFRINVQGTQNVIDAAKAAGVKKLVHVSTEAVLVGGPPIINADETWPRAKTPLGLYPLTKGLAEERVLAANSPDFTTVIMRPRFVWGKGDTTLLPQLVERVKNGSFMWFDGGNYLTSTCHVLNVCEGLMLGAEQGRGGEIYFLTDGEPVQFREFITEMLATQGVTPSNRSIPTSLAKSLAAAAEFVWRTFKLKGEPPVTRSVVGLVGQEVTVTDAKARNELGYVGFMTHDAGLDAMR